jgi:SsrA-binding protein
MKTDTILVDNKKAKMRYQVLEAMNAGLELLGTEVKSLREKRGSLDGARVVVRGGEAYLMGATIPPFQGATASKSYDPERPRRLLLSKREIHLLADAESKKGLTVVPISLYNGKYLKLQIAVVKGKSKTDRREDIKRRESDIEIERAMKQRGRKVR